METSIGQKKPLILLIDKNDIFGFCLGKKLLQQGSVILVTANLHATNTDLIVIPFGRGIPQIPDGIYTHIVFVWSKDAEVLLDPIAKKAEEQHANFFVITEYATAQLLSRKKTVLPITAQELLVGDLFGKGYQSTLNTYLERAKRVGKISLPGMGLRTWKPIAYDDAVAKIADIIIFSKKTSKPFLIAPLHTATTLGIFHAVQKIDPEVKIDFSSEQDDKQQDIGEIIPGFPAYNTMAKIQHYYQQIPLRKSTWYEKKENVVVSAKTKHSVRVGKALYIGYVLFVVCLLPLLTAIFSAAFGTVLLFVSLQGAEKKWFIQAESAASIAQKSFAVSSNALSVVGWEANIVGAGRSVNFLQQNISFASKVSLLAKNGIVIADNSLAIFTGKTLEPQVNAANLVAGIKQFSLTSSQINEHAVPIGLVSSVVALQHLGSDAASIADEIPLVLGVKGDKTYLVLFQNNMELRPGGGFIGSYGILTMHYGAIKSFHIYNVYDADGQLTGHVEPPFPIRRYIPIVHLFLRDSNFDPDFTVDAKMAAFLLAQETGQKVDGVIGVDLDVVKAMLATVGSVYVPGHHQTVTTKNFFTLIEEHAEKNSFPGSIQKQQFLNAFFVAMLAKAKNTKLSGIASLPQEIDSLIKGKHMMLAFSDPLLELPFSLAHMSGSLVDNRLEKTGTVNDFLGVVEANLGVNKVNASITRSLLQEVSVDTSGNIEETVTLTLRNNSNGTWPGGVYKNYIRFIIPNNAILQGISVNGIHQQLVAAVTDFKQYEAKNFVPPYGLEVNKTEEAGKTLYGFLVSVPEKGNLHIAVQYQLPHVTLSNQITYNMLLWKQAGVEAFPYQLQVSVPQGYQLLSGSMKIAKDKQSAILQTIVGGDITVSIVFAKRGN